jgi:Tfp pilus assembly protein PilO
MSTANAATTSRTNDILWATIGILGVIGMGYFYVAPRIASLKESRAITQAKDDDIKELTAQIAQVKQTAKELNSQPDALKQLSLAAPNSTAYDQLLVALQAIATESGVVLTSVQPTSSTAGAAKLAIATVGIKGSYTYVHRFFEVIATNIRPMSISNLALSNAVDVNGVSTVSATLIVTAAQAIAPATAVDAAPTTGGTQ